MAQQRERQSSSWKTWRVWIGLLLCWNHISLAMAVDRAKFRTCAQTSFCRRHRGGHSQRLYEYQLVKDSIQFQPNADENPPKQEEKTTTDDNEESPPTMLQSLTSRLLGKQPPPPQQQQQQAGNNPSSKDDPIQGPGPIVTATLINKQNGERLALSLHLHQDGVTRLRITEEYDDEKAPRWTSDELVLNVEEMKPATSVQMMDGATHHRDADFQNALQYTQHNKKDNYVMLKYELPEQKNQFCFLMLQLEPFALHLWRGDTVTGSPIVSINTDNWMHFEIRRSKDNPTITSDEHVDNEDRHGGKEIVGYWEDGLAIYADGTREERSSGDEDVEHRKLLEEQAPELDDEGMWEEEFQSHVDSKPFGPMSVGADILFPQSQHLFGLPEHASSTQLKTTHGDNAHYKDPYRLYNLDVFEYELDETMALYGEVPLIVSQSKAAGTVGLFWFNPTETYVDVEETPDKMGTKTHWISESGILDIFILPGPNPRSLYEQYAKITGRMPLPPMFSLGYHQCRWNYRDEKDVYDVHGNFEIFDYPYDVLWLDIEHTNGKRYFTWDSNAFPNPKEMQETLNSQGRNMVTIIDPHIMRDNNYYVHKEATAKGLYVKDKTGKKDFDGWCWPGSSSYLDFTDERVRSWWADQFAYDKYQGSTPSLFTWNDMNEPSVFNGPEVSMQKDLLNLAGVEHREWHNLYGMLFQRATSEGQIRRNQPDENERPFVLSRSFFAGSQRYGAIWTGDNCAKWSHLEIAAPMLLSLNTAALSFVGADVGGFFGNPDAELMTRWMQAGAYQPFFRGHAHHDSKRREPWIFGEEWMLRMRAAAMKRYALLPYWYSVFREASVTGMPVMRTMWMQYPEIESLYGSDDQYLIGSDLLVKPITTPGASEVEVHFPTNDNWYDVDTFQELVTESSPKQYGEVASLILTCDLDKIPVYQRGGSIIPRKLRLRRSSRLMYTDPYTLYVALDSSGLASGELYMDDEHSFDHERTSSYGLAKFSVDMNQGFVGNTVLNGMSDWAKNEAKSRMIERIIIVGVKVPPKGISNGKQSIDFHYEVGNRMIVLRKPNVSALSDWEIKIEL